MLFCKNQKLLEVVKDISVISTQKVKIKSEVDLIIQNIGGILFATIMNYCSCSHNIKCR
jgi:hypothetical protein